MMPVSWSGGSWNSVFRFSYDDGTVIGGKSYLEDERVQGLVKQGHELKNDRLRLYHTFDILNFDTFDTTTSFGSYGKNYPNIAHEFENRSQSWTLLLCSKNQYAGDSDRKEAFSKLLVKILVIKKLFTYTIRQLFKNQ